MATKTVTRDEFYKAIEAAGHVLIKEAGEIDIFRMDAGYCNGPGCACGDSWCHHCRKLDNIRPCSRKARG